MSIDQLDKIDFYGVDRERTRVRLVITDHLDWEEFDEGDHLELLQNKINAYLQFVEGGQWVKTRPDLEGVPIVIEVRAKHMPSTEALKFYRLAGPMVAEGGASLELTLTSSETILQF
jgi:hypothetical protein